MHTNRLDSIATRQRANHVRDFFFVMLVTLVLVIQIVSFSQARAFAQDSWRAADPAPASRMAQPAQCISPSQGTLAGTPANGPLC